MTAAEKILQKALVASNIDSREWNSVQAGLRDRAFISSQVAEHQFLDAFRTGSAAHAAGAADISKIRMALRDYLTRKGYQPTDEERGTIKDLTLKARLDVIIKTNVATARGFVRYANGMSPGAFAAFPAMKLLRIRQRKQGRAWDARWKAAGDSVGWKGATPDFGTRTALKDSPIWQALGEGAGGYRDGLGNPFPPFAWGSGVGVVDVSRKEAIELGLISDEELREKTAEMQKQRDAGSLPGMNANMRVEDPNGNLYGVLRKKFGDQIQRDGNVIKWRSEVFKDAFDGGNFTIRLGKAEPSLVSMLPSGIEFNGWQNTPLSITQDWLNNTREDGTDHRSHFDGYGTDAIPLQKGDVDLLPSIWRSPDRAWLDTRKGHEGRNGLPRLILELDAFDGNTLRAVVDIGTNTPYLKTFFKKTTRVSMPTIQAGANGNRSRGIGNGARGAGTGNSVPQTP